MSNNFNMSFDPIIRRQFAELTANYGLTVPQAFRLFANQAVQTGGYPYRLIGREKILKRKIMKI